MYNSYVNRKMYEKKRRLKLIEYAMFMYDSQRFKNNTPLRPMLFNWYRSVLICVKTRTHDTIITRLMANSSQNKTVVHYIRKITRQWKLIFKNIDNNLGWADPTITAVPESVRNNRHWYVRRFYFLLFRRVKFVF